MRLGLSHSNEHKYNHNFHDCVNPFCTNLSQHHTSSCTAITIIQCDQYYSVDKSLLKLSDNELTVSYGSTQQSLWSIIFC